MASVVVRDTGVGIPRERLGLLFWVAVAVLAVRLFATGEPASTAESSAPDEILRQRYARGETSDEKLQERRRVLRDL